ncbi:MAG TPA: uroporphyrinogen-III synthase [Ignavibacteriaceae bacterium]|nr:uroporphyrinogen-III synthase [Ignavibacteriaceae bacterium]
MILEKKRDSKKNIKRKKIIDSASNLFSRNSYHEVMMEDVAKMSGIAKGTVYTYFSSKEELYFSIMRLRMEKLTTSLKEKIKDETSRVDSLHSFVIHLYMFMMKYRDFFLMYRKESLNAENELCSELVALEKELKSLLAGIIESGKSENLFRNIETDFAVDIILGSVYGTIHRGIENNSPEEKLIIEREKVFDFIMHGLFYSFETINSLPLRNKTIVITRAIEQSKESSETFKQLGANVIIFPTLDIVPPDSWSQFDSIITGKAKIDFIIFTSAYAVKMFTLRCNDLNVKLDFNRIKIVAVGNKTAAICERNNIPVHIIPQKYSANGVINELSNYDLESKVIFIPRSAIGREELPEELEKLGAIIKSAPAYNVSIPPPDIIKENLERLRQSNPDIFIFTSPSTFENFLTILKISEPVNYFVRSDVAAIGPSTKTAIENKGVHVSIMPDEYTIDGLAKAIVEYYK